MIAAPIAAPIKILATASWAGTLTEMPPEKDAPENGRQAFVVEKEEKEK